MPANFLNIWPEDKIAILRDCIAKKMSAGKTAEFMGIPKGAANGKAHRLGLKFLSIVGHNRKPAGGTRMVKGQRFSSNRMLAALNRNDPGKAALPEPIITPEFLGKTLFELNDFECHYIEGEDRLYCGQPTNRETAYCTVHHKAMFQKRNPDDLRHR